MEKGRGKQEGEGGKEGGAAVTAHPFALYTKLGPAGGGGSDIRSVRYSSDAVSQDVLKFSFQRTSQHSSYELVTQT